MKKWLLALAVMGVIAVSLVSTGSVFAQTSTPPAPGTGTGYLHDEMVTVYAEALGLSADELDARLDAGETLAQVAYSTGMTADEFRDMVVSLREKAINLALKNGTITQEQADWMLSRWNGQNAGNGNGRGAGMGAGRGAGMGGGRGAFGGNAGTGSGWNANPDCPFLDD
jgi:hypothetical protein